VDALLAVSERKLGYSAGGGIAEVDNSLCETGCELEAVLYMPAFGTVHIYEIRRDGMIWRV